MGKAFVILALAIFALTACGDGIGGSRPTNCMKTVPIGGEDYSKNKEDQLKFTKICVGTGGWIVLGPGYDLCCVGAATATPTP